MRKKEGLTERLLTHLTRDELDAVFMHMDSACREIAQIYGNKPHTPLELLEMLRIAYTRGAADALRSAIETMRAMETMRG
jgi:hypothetical protein